MKQIFIFGFLFSTFFVNYSYGCGYPEELNSTIKKIELGKNVQIKNSGVQHHCGAVFYHIRDLEDGERLGVLLLDPAKLVEFKSEIMRFLGTPFDQLKALDIAYQNFGKDNDIVKEDLGFDISMVNKKEWNGTESGNAIYLDGHALYEVAYQNCADKLAPGFFYFDKVVKYIPGINDYSQASIYRSGDLQKAIKGNFSWFLYMRDINLEFPDAIKNRLIPSGKTVHEKMGEIIDYQMNNCTLAQWGRYNTGNIFDHERNLYTKYKSDLKRDSNNQLIQY